MGCRSEGAWPGQCLRWGCREAQDGRGWGALGTVRFLVGLCLEGTPGPGCSPSAGQAGAGDPGAECWAFTKCLFYLGAVVSSSLFV